MGKQYRWKSCREDIVDKEKIYAKKPAVYITILYDIKKNTTENDVDQDSRKSGIHKPIRN